MPTKREIRENARDFVTRALSASQDKKPTQKAIDQAVRRIVANLEPLADKSHDQRARVASAEN